MSKILVTGGFGLIGSYVIRKLVEQGEDVVCYERLRTPPPGREDISKISKIVTGDITNWVNVAQCLKEGKFDCIYHIAAVMVLEAENRPFNAFNVNVAGTLNMLEAARLFGVPKLIYTSSGFTLSLMHEFASPARVDRTEAVPFLNNIYGTTKMCCEGLGQYYQERYGLDFRAVRFPMVIGPGREVSYYYGDYSGAIQMPALGKSYTIHVNPDNPSGLIYAKDCAESVIALAKADGSRLKQRIYNINGFEATMNEVISSVKKHLPQAQLTVEWDKSTTMEKACKSVNYEMDDKSAREDFGWKSKYPLDVCVEDFIKEVKKG